MVAIWHCARPNKSNLVFFDHQLHVSTTRFIQGQFYGRPVSKSLHGQPPVLGNTPYSKLTAALHGFPAIARLSCWTCFVLSIRNEHSNEINCRRVDRLVSPSWLSPTWLSSRWLVAEMTGNHCEDGNCDEVMHAGWSESNQAESERG